MAAAGLGTTRRAVSGGGHSACVQFSRSNLISGNPRRNARRGASSRRVPETNVGSLDWLARYPADSRDNELTIAHDGTRSVGWAGGFIGLSLVLCLRKIIIPGVSRHVLSKQQ